MIVSRVSLSIEEQDTQPLPMMQLHQMKRTAGYGSGDPLRYQWLKEGSDRTGVRLLLVYLAEKKYYRQRSGWLSEEGMQ